MLEVVVGDSYQPPPGAVTVEVAVGGRLSLRAPQRAPHRVERLPYRHHR